MGRENARERKVKRYVMSRECESPTRKREKQNKPLDLNESGGEEQLEVLG